MDSKTYDKLNYLLLSEGSLTIMQFQEMLSKTLGSEAPLVKQLQNWESNDYEPGQLLNLKSVLRQEVVSKTPSFNSMKDTAKLIEDDINGVNSLQNILFDLFNVQQLHKWVSDYETTYRRATDLT